MAWAYVKDGKIQKIYSRPKSLILGEVRYPSNMFTKYTDAEKAAIGIYSVVDTGTKGDNRFQNTSQATYTFDSSNNRVTTSYTVTDRELADSNVVDADGKNLLDVNGNQIINYGLKHYAKEQAKKTAHDLIKRFGWLVQRVTMDSSKTIPSAVITYCANIRTDCANIITAIDNASDMTAFKALYQDTYNSDGSVNVVARVNRWSDDYDVQQYVR